MARDENALAASELRQRNDAGLVSLLATKLEELHKAKFQRSLGQASESHSVQVIKKDVARIKTIQRERATGAEG